MRTLIFGLVSIFVAGACGKKVEAPVAVDAAAAVDTAAAPEPDAAAVAPDMAAVAPDVAAVAPDTAPAVVPDAAVLASDVAATADAALDGGAAALPEPTPPPKPFDDMTEIEQKQHMKQVVLPVMRARFQQFDPEQFAKVNCVTCHGKGALEGKFELPNPELTKLPKTREGFMKLAETKQKTLDFMGKVVVPAMAIMVGEAPFDPATQKGFGCFECHTTE